MQEYQNIIDKLNMIPHPEGGFYIRNWQSTLSADVMDSTGKIIFPGRKIGSSIIYLLPGWDKSTWHRVNCDEMWHFYGGSALRMYFLTKSKGLETLILGSDVLANQNVQIIVHRQTWFAAEVIDPNSYCMAGCTLSPSFSYTDFEIAERERLIDEYPQYKDAIDHIYKK